MYKLTYTISDEAEGDQTIDLTYALSLLREYAAQTGNEADVLEPGDTRVYEIYIQSDSQHTYKYKSGSFVLETPELDAGSDDSSTEETETAETAENEDDTVYGFDGQELTGEYIGDDTFEISSESAAVREILEAAGIGYLTGQHVTLTTEYQQKVAEELEKRLNELGAENAAVADLSLGFQEYLLAYYSNLDGTDYADFETMMRESETAIAELATGTSSNYPVTLKSDKVTNTNVAYKLNGNSSDYLDSIKNMVNQLTGGEVDLSNCKNLTRIKLALKNNSKYADIAANELKSTNLISTYLRLYDKLNGGEGAAYKAYAELTGYTGTIPFNNYGAYYTVINSSSSKITAPLDTATKYNNFYQNLISFVYGDTEDIGKLSGEIKEKQYTSVDYYTATDYTVDENGNVISSTVYENCVKASCLATNETVSYYLYKKVITSDSLCYVTEDGEILFLTDETRKPITASNDKYTHTATYWQTEYDHDSWNFDGNSLTIGDYMQLFTDSDGNYIRSETWTAADNYFNTLLAEGISASNAVKATCVKFNMAFNVDGELTGNTYQDTDWSWYNAISLEQVDGEFHLTKTDESGNIISNDETSSDKETDFQIWYISQMTDKETNETKDVNMYLMQNTDGSYTFTMDKSTVSTVGGKLDVLYTLMTDLVYYLQEEKAPAGYSIDTQVYVIMDKEAYDSMDDDAKAELAKAAGTDSLEWLADVGGTIEIDGITKQGAKVSFRNVQLVVSDSTPDEKSTVTDNDDPADTPDNNTPDNNSTEPVTTTTVSRSGDTESSGTDIHAYTADASVSTADIPDEGTPAAETPEVSADIPDEKTPAAEAPEEGTDIPDEDIPMADVPETGDCTMNWCFMVLASGMMLAWVTLAAGKRRNLKKAA